MQLTISPARHEIMWRDGSAIGVHPVQRDGVPEIYLRAVHGPDLRPVVIDLRRVAPGIDHDLATAPQRDRIGIVFFTLRHRYPSAGAFRAAALEGARVDVQALQLEEAA
jgi:hypothetical protein